MKIDYKRLEDHLQKYRVTEKPSFDESGVSRVIQYVWGHYSTGSVNFNSFTLSDSIKAFYEFYALPHHDDDVSPSDLLSIKDNHWEIHASMDDVIAALAKNKNKVFENDDDFI